MKPETIVFISLVFIFLAILSSIIISKSNKHLASRGYKERTLIYNFHMNRIIPFVGKMKDYKDFLPPRLRDQYDAYVKSGLSPLDAYIEIYKRELP